MLYLASPSIENKNPDCSLVFSSLDGTLVSFSLHYCKQVPLIVFPASRKTHYDAIPAPSTTISTSYACFSCPSQQQTCFGSDLVVCLPFPSTFEQLPTTSSSNNLQEIILLTGTI